MSKIWLFLNLRLESFRRIQHLSKSNKLVKMSVGELWLAQIVICDWLPRVCKFCEGTLVTCSHIKIRRFCVILIGGVANLTLLYSRKCRSVLVGGVSHNYIKYNGTLYLFASWAQLDLRLSLGYVHGSNCWNIVQTLWNTDEDVTVKRDGWPEVRLRSKDQRLYTPILRQTK